MADSEMSPKAKVTYDQNKFEVDLNVAYYNRGTILYRLGSHEEALPDLKLALDKEPNNTDYKEALEACQKQPKQK